MAAVRDRPVIRGDGFPSLIRALRAELPRDQVVWINTRTGIYHLQGERWFGRTGQGK